MNKITIIVLGFFIVALLSVLFSSQPLLVKPTSNTNVYQNVSSEKNLAKTAKLLQDAQVTQALEGGTTFTVFAPTDDAYAKLPANVLTRLSDKNNPHAQIYTANNHLVLGNYPTSTFYEGMKLTTVDAQELTLTKKNGFWYINNTTRITKADVPSKNGVIHTIDSVLLPTDFNN